MSFLAEKASEDGTAAGLDREIFRLRQSESMLRSILENVPVIVARLNLDGTVAFANRFVEGMRREDVIGRPATDFIPEEFRPMVREFLEGVIKNRKPWECEYPGPGPGGTTAIYMGRVSPVIEGDEVTGLSIVAEDVTERRRAERAFQESEMRLRMVVNRAPVILFALDRRGRITLSEGRALEKLGQKPGESVGQSILEKYRDVPQAVETIKKALSGEKVSGILEGRGMAWDCHFSPLQDGNGNPNGVIGVATDISDQRRIEEQIRQYADIVEHIQLGLYVHRIEKTADGYTTRLVNANPAAELLTGRKNSDLIGRTIDESFPHLRSRGLVDLMANVSRTGISAEVDDFWFKEDGALNAVWSFTVFPLSNECVGVAFQDVTQKKRSEYSLRQSEELNRRIIEAVPAGIIQVTDDGRIVHVNRQAEQLFGLAASEFTRLRITDFASQTFHEDGSPCPVSDYPITKCLRTREAQPPETIGVRKSNGEVFWAIFTAVPLCDPHSGTLTGAVVTFLDITERKRIEQALRLSEAQLLEAQRISQLGSWSWNIETGEVQLSDGIYRIFGLPPREVEVTSERFLGAIDPQDRERVEAEAGAAIQAQRPFEVDFRITRPTGEVRHLHANAEVGQDRRNRTVLMTGIIQDVTAQRRAEEALRESERRYRSYVDNAPHGVFVADENGRYVEVNPAGCRISGYEEDELLRMGIADTLPAEALPEGLAHFTELREKGDSYAELPFLRKKGEQGWWSVAGIKLSNKRFLGFVTDITDRKRAEESLRENEARFRAIFEQAAVGVAQIDSTTGRFLRVNRKYRSILGYTQDEMLQLDFMGITHPDDLKPDLTYMQRLRSGELREFTMEKRLFRKDGETVWVNLSVAAMWPPGTPATQHIAVVEDITDRKRAEENLRRERQRLLAILNAVPECVKVVSHDGRILEMNAPGLRIIEAGTQEEVIGRSVYELIPPEQHEAFRNFLETARREGKQSLELEINTLTGDRRWMSSTAVPLRDEDSGEINILAVTEDVTQEKTTEERTRQMEAELAHVTRLSTMGEMASGLAHELNQPLAAIIGYTDACQELLTAGRIDREQLTSVMRATSKQAERAGQIIHRLRKMIKKSGPVVASINIGDAIREVAALMESEIQRQGVSVILKLNEKIPAVRADFIQIQQVILNLMRNACDAMRDCPADRRALTISARTANDRFVEISVSDRGEGMNAEQSARLFEPFFSTKPEGLGMGLPISRSIVEAHGGRLWMTPNPDGGLTFRLTLPIIDTQGRP